MSNASKPPASLCIDRPDPVRAISRAKVLCLAHSRARYERDLHLCVANGVRTPLAMPLGDIAAWRAAHAKMLPHRSAPPYRAFFAIELKRAWEDARGNMPALKPRTSSPTGVTWAPTPPPRLFPQPGTPPATRHRHI